MRKARPAWVQDWLDRHRSPLSFWLHIVGIPLVVAAVVTAGVQLHLWAWDAWYLPVLLFLIGYGLQALGHMHEGNDMGEIIVVKRWLGLPYVAVSPRYEERRGTT
ncbi:MAG: Mpo1-like protein [Phycisphaerae bacterium]